MPGTARLLLLDVEPAETAISTLHAAHEAPPVPANAAVVPHVLGIRQRYKPHVLGRVIVAVDQFFKRIESPLDAAHMIGLGARLAMLIGPYLRRATDVIEIIVDAIYARLRGRRVLTQGNVGGVAAINQLDIGRLVLEAIVLGHRYSYREFGELCTYNQVKEIWGCAQAPVGSTRQDLGYMRVRIKDGSEGGSMDGQARRYTARRAGAPCWDVELTAGFKGAVSGRAGG